MREDLKRLIRWGQAGPMAYSQHFPLRRLPAETSVWPRKSPNRHPYLRREQQGNPHSRGPRNHPSGTAPTAKRAAAALPVDRAAQSSSPLPPRRPPTPPTPPPRRRATAPSRSSQSPSRLRPQPRPASAAPPAAVRDSQPPVSRPTPSAAATTAAAAAARRPGLERHADQGI